MPMNVFDHTTVNKSTIGTLFVMSFGDAVILQIQRLPVNLCRGVSKTGRLASTLLLTSSLLYWLQVFE